MDVRYESVQPTRKEEEVLMLIHFIHHFLDFCAVLGNGLVITIPSILKKIIKGGFAVKLSRRSHCENSFHLGHSLIRDNTSDVFNNGTNITIITSILATYVGST